VNLPVDAVVLPIGVFCIEPAKTVPFKVVVAVPAFEPIVIAVVEPANPPVPMLIVLVLPELVALS
jgi:hypothetical protein